MATYKGVEIVVPKGEIHLSHSRFIDCDENANYLEMLSEIPLYDPKNWLKDADGNDVYARGGESKLFRQISRVFSVASRNYQICNGGIGQYYGNRYHEPRDPYRKGDCARYGRGSQLYFIKGELNDFAREVLPATEYSDYLNYVKINSMSSNGYEASWDVRKAFPNVRRSNHIGIWDLVYYEYNEVFEKVLELYAQYVFKRYAEENPWVVLNIYFNDWLSGIRYQRERRRREAQSEWMMEKSLNQLGELMA